MRLAILRAAKLPSLLSWITADINTFFAEDDLLIRALNTAGFQASAVVWSDPTVDWNQFDAAIIRSTWDYLDDPDRFLDVLQTIEDSPCKLFNDRATVKWNIDKHYLLDLDRRGVAVVPSVIVSAGSSTKPAAGSRTLVLKPVVGLAATDLIKIGADELDSTLAEIGAANPGREYLLQPFVESITSEGEFSFVFFNGLPQYVIVKRPAAGDFRSQPLYGSSLQLIEPVKADLDQANAVIEALAPVVPLYARVDMVRLDGRLHVMELELIEPFLFFDLFPDHLSGFVRAAQDRLNGAGRLDPGLKP